MLIEPPPAHHAPFLNIWNPPGQVVVESVQSAPLLSMIAAAGGTTVPAGDAIGLTGGGGGGVMYATSALTWAANCCVTTMGAVGIVTPIAPTAAINCAAHAGVTVRGSGTSIFHTLSQTSSAASVLSAGMSRLIVVVGWAVNRTSVMDMNGPR